MSKQWVKALRAWAHPSFMQRVRTGDDDPARLTLDIRLMDYDIDNNKTTACDTRYVKISSPSGGDAIYPLCLQDGEAYLRLEDLECSEIVLVQCDEYGNAYQNGDESTIMYEVNGHMSQKDEAWITEQQGDQTITIINMPMKPLTLHIVKKLCDEFGEEMDFQNDMCFIVHLQGCGIHECIKLDMSNQFHATLTDLKPGNYEIFEEDTNSMVLFSLDGATATQSAEMILPCGIHTLEVINQKQSRNTLMIDQYIRCDNGELIKPNAEACFSIHVFAQNFDEHFMLNKDNDFSLYLQNVPSGQYEIVADGCHVTYLIDAALESDEACFELDECDHVSVLIIEKQQEDIQMSPLRICKYVRRSDNSLVKPNPQENFKVMLSGCGSCQIFNLNAHNNFCVDIEHICNGHYEIRELDHENYVASYIIDDGCESTCADLWIQEGCYHCVTIINEEKNKGEITISKVIRQSDGNLIKPEKNARFLVTLRSFFCRETYVLDNSNDFCVHIHHLKEGSYEVRERSVDGYETTYMVNGGKEKNKARFVLTNDTCHDIKIINSVKREINGDLRICKFLANAYGDYVKPSADEAFEIHVEGPCFDACYTLRAANSWCILLEGLKKGVYRIREQQHCHYDTQYFVNGDEMSEEALVCMDQQSQDVVIVNTKRTYGNLKVNIMVEDCDHCMHKPKATEYFDVIVETREGSRKLRFDERNNFGMVLEDLPSGKVVIMQKDSYGYRVLYEVNHHRHAHGEVIMDGANATVTIINQMMNCSGVVRVRKLVKTLHGRIIKPCEEDCYEFILHGHGVHQEVTLNGRNHFQVMFDDLEEGTYEIKEQAIDGMETSYRINGTLSDKGCFTLDRDDVDIDIINTVLPLPKLCIQKRIRKNGTLIKPQRWETFHFTLIGRDVHETYCLNQENDWCVTLEELYPQHYEIKEENGDGRVQYQIDDQLCESGSFLFGHEDMAITIINEVPSDALVRIRKMMRDLDGNLCKPSRGDRFEAVLENACYKQCFTLEERNDWCVEIEGLMEGMYTVSEQGGDHYEVLIHGCHQEDGTFTLKEQDVNVTLVNALGCENALIISAHGLKGEQRVEPDEDQIYHIHVEHEGICDAFTLSKANHWAIELANINLGMYRIYADETVLYEACGQWFECGIDIEMGCGDINVNLYEEQSGPMITIKKRLQDENGQLLLPHDETETMIMLCSHIEECFALHKDNEWSIHLCDYPCGDYEVTDMSCDDVSYQINGTMQERGTFTVTDENIEIVMIRRNTTDDGKGVGNLSVHALVRNVDGELESANSDARFEVRIDGAQVQEDITLSERNGFLMRYEHLPKGKYQITQVPQPDFGQLVYRINGKEQTSNIVTLQETDVQVDLINERKCACGSIYVMKYLKDDTCGCLKRPCMDESYEITLTGRQLERHVELNKDNHWSALFDDLPQGTYMLKETSGNATYIINGGKEQEEACITLTGNQVNVKVINTMMNQAYGSLELCKYLVDANGNRQMPKEDDRFWISVTSKEDRHRILLHAANHFYAQLHHLPAGVYEVVEEDGNGVSYQVNGRISERGIVAINGNHNDVDICNPLHETSIALTKMIQADDGSLAIAQSGQYRIHISAPGYHSIVTLDETNAYHAVVNDVSKGYYVIDELDHEDVSYIIDHKNQVDRAIVNVQGNHEVMIINPLEKMNNGEIKLHKYLRNDAGLLIRPSGDASYQFHVSKPGYQRLVTLDQSNHWSATLSDLADGNYVIQELDQSDVSYIINEGSECDFGIVKVAGNSNRVSIINQEKQRGSITITKYVRNDDDSLVSPNGDYEAKVHVSKSGFHEVVTLNQTNGWQATLTNLIDGDYVLDEMEPKGEVTWRIDGGYEVNYAIVHVTQNDHQVDMINHEQSNANTLELIKYIKQANGGLIRPADGDQFQVEVKGNQFQQTVTLTAANQFHMRLSDLASGIYTIQERNQGNYVVTYRINGAMETSSAIVSMSEGKNNVVEIINEPKANANVVDVYKYVMDPNGNFEKPQHDQSFRFLLTGNNMHQFYTLNAQNDWHVQIATLANGEYEVMEQTPNGKVQYIVNGGEPSSIGEFSVFAGSVNTVEIINQATNKTNGTIVLEKKIRNENGDVVSPGNGESFMIRLASTELQYEEIFTLDALNGYTLNITNLAHGTYQVSEVDTTGYGVSYVVNGEAASDHALVFVNDARVHEVSIINTKMELFFDVSNRDDLHVIIE